MAKKKKKRTSSRRRRRIGALGLGKVNYGELAMDGLGLGLGAFSANMVNKGVTKLLPKANPKVKAIAPMALGLGAMAFAGKNRLIRNAGAGLFAVSVSGALTAFGIGQAPVADDVDKLLNEMQNAQREATETEEAYAQDMGSAPLAGTNEVGLPD